MPHVKRPEVFWGEAVHVTLRCVVGLPTLRHPVSERIIVGIFTAERSRKGFRLVNYSIQGNHLHLICEGVDEVAVSRGVQRITSRVARALNKRWERRGRLFADRFHGEVIRTPKHMRNALRYVYLHVHRHKAASGVVYVGTDPFTSTKWFDGWAHLREPPPMPTARDPVTRGKCWLLQEGWLKGGGPIRTDEMARKLRGRLR
jgi:REP element-mobilizing transposase RayT